MNPLYLATLRRHPILFLVPVVLAGAVAMWFTLGEPKMYRASASLWSDAGSGAAAEAAGAPPPAAQEQSLLNELLTTQSFREAVAHRGPLAGYLERHPTEGWGPTALVANVRGAGTADERIRSALGPDRVTSIVQGPHVLEVRYDAPSPTLAAETLRALIQEFEEQRTVLNRAALGSYRDQVEEASEALIEARTNLQEHFRENPESAGSGPELRELAEAERDAVERLAAASDQLNQLSTSTTSAAAVETTLRVIDAPEAPTAPNSGPKRSLLALIAGLFAGALVSALAVVALARTGRPAHSRDDPLLGEAGGPAGEDAGGERDDGPVLVDAFAERRTTSR